MLQFAMYFFGAAKVAAFCLFSLACLTAAENAAAAGTGEAEKTPPTLPAVRAVDGFALRAAAEFRKSNGDFFFSPYSILSVLGMAYEGSAGVTREAMAKALSLDDGFHASLGALSTGLRERMDGQDDQPVLNDANRVWLMKGLAPRSGFGDVLSRDYGGAAEELDFKDAPEEARQRINGWVSDRTKGRIKDLILDVPKETRMILTNAVYFKGRWLRPFSAELTVLEPFHVTETESKDVPMMKEDGEYLYAEADGVKLLKLSYGGSASMLLALPKQGAMDELLKDLAHRDGLDLIRRWQASMTRHQVDVWLPKFKMEERYELKELLMAFGMGQAFSDAADFSAMTESKEPICIGSVVHKTFLEVDEEGAEAAAATGMTMVYATALPPQDPPRAEFHADRPFLFFILDDMTGAILFMGTQSFK